MKQTFLEQFLGTPDPVTFAVSYLFALIGAFIMLRYEAHKRDKSSKNTPNRFDASFMLKDNLIRIFSTLLLIFVGIRFSSTIFGQDVTFYGALIIGASLDKVSEYIKNISKSAR